MLRTRSLSAPLPAALTAAAVLAGTAALLAGNAARGADRIDGWNIGTAAAQAPMPPHGGPGPVPPDQTIMVSGQGTVEAMPDQAMITVGFQITRPTANDAQDRASRAMTQILEQIAAVGVPRERIRTIEINLYPQRRPQSDDISGYQAVQRVTVTLDDLALVGRVLDASVAAGANLLEGATFTLRDPAAARSRALAAAMQDARSAANALASAAGLTPPRLVRIQEVGGSAPPRAAGIHAPNIAMTATPVAPGTLSVSEQVMAIYRF
ncbi:MAG: DUF541 domain-containing protein [Bacillati bacterium ANGP1]|uniref:DUF541 domain-containing protein n=1 Tax=Candidatus Segetimicrobium genomatis TaxID=2569760 RepID=A0A537K5G3_9BACT|nr:MAG: DUF541 domain-containing protein [Terrabacteria group bacterium ANGP1]